MTDTERIEDVEIDTENNCIVIGDFAITVQGKEGEPLAIDHTSPDDGYVAFLEAGENGVKPGGEAATITFTEVPE